MTGKQLKNSILQWAIQGKLVPQDPNDEPASVLLEKIRAEKARLIKEGKIKKDKKESIIYRGDDNSYYEKFADGKVVCIDDEIPFELPKTWSWIRLKYVSEIARGGSPRPIKEFLTYSVDGINWIKIGDTEKDGMYINSTKEKIKPEGLSKSRLVHKGDFLLTNSMSFGRPYITNIDGCIHDGWLVISPVGTSYMQKFLYYLLSSGYAFSQFSGKVSGAVVKNLNSEKVADALFPLPPYNEQQRILDKLEEIIPKVNTYGLVADTISSMNQSLKPKLRKSILQEAIQGKLVPQDVCEEPASILLKRIREEKQKLVKEGLLKKKDVIDSTIFRGDYNKYYEKIGKSQIDITDDIPFDIPSNWVWTRIGYLFAHNNGKQLNKGNSVGTLMEYITTSNLYWDGFRLENLKRMPFEENEIERCQAIKGDLLVCEGGDVGRSCIWPYDYPIMLQNHIHKLRAYLPLCTKYFFYIFYLYNLSGLIGGKGIGIQGFSAKALHNTIIPLPPLMEQERIVKKIETVLNKIEGF